MDRKVKISVQLPNTAESKDFELPFGDQSRRVLARLQEGLREQGVENTLENDHNSLEQALGTN
jgi:hypothetical protein